jgi:tetratricopeptide (TPR) repeat protein
MSVYGVSKAAKLNEAGEFEQAIVEATAAAAAEPGDPEPLIDRAFAHAQLERYADAVADLERALELDRAASVLDEALVDDALFSALLGQARAEAAGSPERAVATLARYRALRPTGGHAREVEEWTRRLRGEVRTEWVKRRVDEA